MAKLDRPLKMGMIGGGPGAFIGEVHRKAARLDGGIQLVAGCFSSKPEKSQQTGEELMLDPKRIYNHYSEMIDAEKKLPEGERIDFVSIVTPNNMHFPVARDFLFEGFNVLCDKPMTLTIDEARKLVKQVKESGKLFGLTHNYTGYPMVKLARDMVRQGDLGKVRKIVVKYPQGWLAQDISNKQADWRSDPKQSGAAGSIGDIGTHAENLAEYITGLRITEICADLTHYVPGRALDDDGNILLRFEEGAKGLITVSQISVGEENGLAIYVYGEKGGLEWHQENPNYLITSKINQPKQIWCRGNDYIGEKSEAAARATRLPFGHPEGFIEAFANLYNNYADTLRALLTGEEPTELELDFPTVHDGLRGMLFIDTVVKSTDAKEKWLEMPKE